MSATIPNALARLAERRFQSFSEAADAVLELLERELPADAILLGQLDWDEGAFRLMDVRGTAPRDLRPGSVLPLAGAHEGNGSPKDGLLDPGALRALAVRSYLAIPFETSDGSGALTLCALASGAGVFTAAHLDLLALTGRLLTYEWESVRWRAELRRMAERLRDPERTDPVTGLPNGASFGAALDREWRLAQRGTLDSYLVVCRAADLAAVSERAGDAMAQLLLKDMAEVLGGAIRRTDHIGRSGADEISVVLVGCKGREGAKAFFNRFQEAFASVTSGRPTTLAVRYGISDLSAAASSDSALQEAREAAAATVSPERV